MFTRRTARRHRYRAACLWVFALALLAWLPPAALLSASAPEDEWSVFLPMVSKLGAPQVVGELPFDPYATRTGQATYYDANGGGNCSFPPSPSNLMVAAMNQIDYHNSLICGAFVEIDGPKGKIVVQIVDRCPECPSGNIDLSKEAFAKIADLQQGRVPISWEIISPALSGPIQYQFKEGSSKWWLAVQIRNHRNPIWSVEYLDKAGQFKPLERKEYNYFVEPDGTGEVPELLTLRVTDIHGNIIVDSGLALVAESVANGSAQFPVRP